MRLTRPGQVTYSSLRPVRQTTETSLTDDVSQIVPFLSGKKLNIAGFDEEFSQVRGFCPDLTVNDDDVRT